MNGKFYYIPTYDMEDIADWKLFPIEKLKNLLFYPKDILADEIKKLKNKSPEHITAFMTKIVNKIAELFFDRVLRDMIENNAIFMMPREHVYMVIAQQSTKSGNHSYDKKHGQSRVMPFIVFTKRGFGIAKGRKKMITLSRKYTELLNEELNNGHIYPVIDEIIAKMKNYGY